MNLLFENLMEHFIKILLKFAYHIKINLKINISETDGSIEVIFYILSIFIV